MIVQSSDLNNINQDLYCKTCNNHTDQVHVWWTDGRNDDGIGYCEVHVDCAVCQSELLRKSAVGEIKDLTDAIGIITAN